MKNLLFTFFASFILFTTSYAQTTWMVDSLNDSGLGSLRAAADSAVAGDTIRFNPNLIASGSDSIVLTTGEIAFDSVGVVIKGLYTTTDTLFISGNDSSRIFSFNGAGRVVLDSLVLRNGNGVGVQQNGKGGAVSRYQCTDTLFLVNSIISGNTANSAGGGIYSRSTTSSSSITVTNSTISGNTTNGSGGGIYSSSSAPSSSSSITLTNSMISGNTANGSGGGIHSYSYSFSSSVTVINSTIFGNTAFGDGGGVFSMIFDYNITSSSITVMVTNSTISGNTAVGHGGGISSTANYSTASITVIVTNSTISGNTASGRGGGISSYSTSSFSSLTVINSTISGNIASGNGGGLSSNGSSYSSVFVTNSTISGNSSNQNGGGVHSYSSISSVTITKSTISGNIASGNIVSGYGGGVYSSGGPSCTPSVTITESTISGNTAFSNGKGLYSYSDISASSSINITSSIVAENGSNSSGVFNSDSITIISNGYNIFSDILTGTIGSDSTNITAAQLNLQGLAFNGGFTQTRLPSNGSIAIGNGNPNDSSDAQNAPIVGVRDVGAAETCIDKYTDTQNACYNFLWVDGVVYYANTDTVTMTFVNSLGCDSIVTLNLIMDTTQFVTDVITACSSYTWIDGVTYTLSNNTAVDTLVSGSGCDSIVTLDLTIFQSSSSLAVISACGSYTWNGTTYSSNNNTAQDTLVNAAGCDSIVTLNLTILNSTSFTDVISDCNPITWIDGNTYSVNNSTATHTLVNAAGCDSIVTLDFTLLPATFGTDVISGCNPITWIDGNTYSVNNNTATHTLVNAVGCDSIITLDFTLLQATSGTDVITSCNSITWIDGITYNQTTNSPVFTIPNSQGCDSVVTLDFTLLEADTTVTRNYLTLTAQANNASYQWIDCDNGVMTGETNASFTATVNGNYQVEITQNGCVDTSACFAITNVGVEGVELIGVSLYPNPTSDVLNIDKGSNVSLEITITNSAGAMVHHSTSKNQITTINMAKMATGMYVVTLKNELGMKVEKVVKR